MTKGNILVVFLFITPITLAQIPYKEVAVGLMGKHNEDIKSELEGALKEPDNVFDSLEADITTLALTKSVGFIPVVGDAFSVIIDLSKIILSKSIEEKRLQPIVEAIQKQIDKTVVEERLKNARIAIDALTSNANILKTMKSRNYSREYPIIVNMETELQKLVGDFLVEDSKLEKFSLMALPHLLTLASFVSVFEVMKHGVDEQFANTSQLPCKMTKALEKFRPLVVEERALALHSPYSPYIISWTYPILQLPYRANGYIQRPTLDCAKKDRCEGSLGCINDKIDETYYDAIYGTPRNCYRGYLKLLRHTVENAFRRPIFMVDRFCMLKTNPLWKQIETTRKNRFPNTTDLAKANLLKTSKMFSERLKCEDAIFESWREWMEFEHFKSKDHSYHAQAHRFVDNSYAINIDFQQTPEFTVEKPYKRTVISESWGAIGARGLVWAHVLVLDKNGRPVGVFRQGVPDVFHVYHNNYWEVSNYSLWRSTGVLDVFHESFEASAPILTPKCDFIDRKKDRNYDYRIPDEE